jgi:hypothetical protein
MGKGIKFQQRDGKAIRFPYDGLHQHPHCLNANEQLCERIGFCFIGNVRIVQIRQKIQSREDINPLRS